MEIVALVVYFGIGLVFTVVMLLRNLLRGEVDLGYGWKAIIVYLVFFLAWFVVLGFIIIILRYESSPEEQVQADAIESRDYY